MSMSESDTISNLDFSGKTALITGASRGIGRAVAKLLAQSGAHVIVMARTVGALEKLDDEIREMPSDGYATIIPCDLRKGELIDTLGPHLAERFGGLDILVANAGMLGPLTPVSHLDPKKMQEILCVNVEANLRLIRTLDPLLRASDAGRALFVTSGMAEKCTAYWGGYAASKAALSALVKTYAAEVEDSYLKVNLMRPGVVDTQLLQDAFPGGFPGETITADESAKAFLPYLHESCTEHGALISPFL